jgi:uncharacterized membrane protein YkoI
MARFPVNRFLHILADRGLSAPVRQLSGSPRYDGHMKTLVLLSALLATLPLAVGGQEPALPDFEIAEDAVARGEILPLAEILTRVQTTHPGRVTEVELEFSDGIRVYEVDVVTPDGRLIEVDLDARTGEVIDFEEEDDD